MFETILVTTDGSENAARAAAVAGNLAATYDALLVIVHVAPLFVGLNEIIEGPQARHLPEKVRGDIEALQTQMGGWEQTPFAQVPAPPSAVAFLNLKNLVMGSVSHKVLQLADCPCVIVK